MTASIERAAPLAAWGQRLAAASATAAAFSIREVAFTSQLNIRGNAADPAFAGAVRGVLGCDLPVAANTWASGNDCTALWLGPDEWLVVAPDGRNAALEASLHSALKGIHHSVTDLSANRTILEVSGEYARLVLAKAQMILQCLDSRPTFRIFVRISFAPYVAEWLTDAAAELAASRNIDTGRIATRLS